MSKLNIIKNILILIGENGRDVKELFLLIPLSSSDVIIEKLTTKRSISTIEKELSLEAINICYNPVNIHEVLTVVKIMEYNKLIIYNTRDGRIYINSIFNHLVEKNKLYDKYIEKLIKIGG